MTDRIALQLTRGDIEVFWYLWMLQVLTLDQIRRLRYFRENEDSGDDGRLSHPDNVRKRLARLMKSGFLIGDDIWNEETRKRIRIYRLGKEALPYLREQYGIDQSRLYTPKEQTTFRQVYHALLVSECAVRVTESLRGSSFVLPYLGNLPAPFILTHTVEKASAKKHTERFFSQKDISGTNHYGAYRIRPDLVFALGKNGVYRLFFLEADRGTESVKEIATKHEGYHAYATAPDPLYPQQKLWERYEPGCRDFRVLIVTTTEKRLHLLREKLSSVKGFDRTAMTAVQSLHSDNMVFGEVWWVKGRYKERLAVC